MAFVTVGPIQPSLCPNSAPKCGHRRSMRMALTTNPKREEMNSTPVYYIGKAPEKRRGRLRVDFSERFQDSNVDDDIESAAAAMEAAAAAANRKYQWSSGGYTQLSRSISVWSFIARLLTANWIDQRSWTYLSGKTDEKRKKRLRGLAAWARSQILDLGPTFIKLGQLASTRADVLPREVTEELRGEATAGTTFVCLSALTRLLVLQDRVPPFPWSAAEKILEEQYGRPVAQVFRFLDKTPLAAASLGQVHRATLFSGEDVVVKIQRPGLQRLFELDLNAMRDVAQYLQKSKKYGGNGRDWVGIYEETQRVLYEEIDYVRECESAIRFGENFASIDYVRVPRAYPDYTTRTVLCLQYLPGIRISDRETLERAGLNLTQIAENVARAYLLQILEFCFFTADPHSGNFSVGPGNVINFYDFGMMVALSPDIKKRLVDILAGVVDRDADVVMNALVQLDALVLPADPLPVRRSIQFFLNALGSRPSRDQTVAAIGEDLYVTAYDRPFRLPAQSIFLLRALSTLEGLNKSLDPEFQFSSVALPFADELLGARRADFSPQGIIRSVATSLVTGRSNAVTDGLRKQAVDAGVGALKANARLDRIDKTLARLERGDLKVRSRSTEAERLLRKQYMLTESSNFLLSSGATALAATQLYVSGNLEPAVAMAILSVSLGFAFIRKASKLKKNVFEVDDSEN